MIKNVFQIPNNTTKLQSPLLFPGSCPLGATYKLGNLGSSWLSLLPKLWRYSPCSPVVSWPSFLYHVHTRISPLPRGRLQLFLTQRATTHRKAFMKGISRSALWSSGPSLDLVSLSLKQAEMNKGAVEVHGLHSVASWRTATGHLTFSLRHH